MKMFSGKKALGLALALALLVNLIAFGASAALDDGAMNTVVLGLSVGTGTGAGFAPLAPGAQPAAGDVLTVRISSATDFWLATHSYAVSFEREFFSFVEAPLLKNSFQPNYANAFCSQAMADWSVTLEYPLSAYTSTAAFGPTLGPAMYAQYATRQVTPAVNGTAPNGGYGVKVDGTWIYEFQLNVLKNLTPGSDARIYIDSAWLRSSSNTAGRMYFTRCTSPTMPHSSASAIASNNTYQLDVSGADIVLPAAPAQSTVTFNTGEGSPIAPLTGNVGDSVPVVPNPTRMGYTFTGWDLPYPETFPSGGLTLTAGWSVNTYNAKFYVDGALYQTVPTEFGAAIVPPADPDKPGHTFKGWDFIPASMPPDDVNINAIFDVNTYDAKFYVDGALYATVPTGFGKPVALPADPDKTGCTFTGWDTVPAAMPANDVDINATFSVNSYNARFYVDGAFYAAVPTPFGQPVVPPAAPVKTGYTFTVWDTVPAAMPANDVDINAVFSANIYDANFYVDGGLYATIPAEFGTTISLPAAPSKFGYTFTGWDPTPGVMDSEGAVFQALFKKDATSVFFAEFDNPYFGAYFAPMTVKVYGSPTQIQFYRLGNGATVTYIRGVNPNILSIQGYDQYGSPVAAGSPALAYETWVINVNLSEADYVVRAKFPVQGTLLKTQPDGAQINTLFLFDPVGQSYPLTVVFQATQYVSCVIDNPSPARGTPMVFTVVTTMDVPKIQFVTPGGSTLTYHINYAVYTDDITTGMRTWTITRTASIPGPATWTLRCCVGKIWSDTGL
ncbi:MAG TPA: InlB B-repeat-containing protein, partial [Clostridiales bacterium]|nr:InlB B-repeat-containing protein [Clostridiales bacterium]